MDPQEPPRSRPAAVAAPKAWAPSAELKEAVANMWAATAEEEPEAEPEAELETETESDTPVLVCGREVDPAATELDLSRTAAEGADALSGLPQLVALRTLDLSNSDLGDAAWAGLVAALKLCPALAHVKLSRCGLDPKRATDLAGWVRDTAGSTVASIVLSGNMITARDEDLSGLTAIGEAMALSKTLTSIDFSMCGLGSKGLTVVADVVPKMAAIAEVILDGCPLTAPAQCRHPHEHSDSQMDGFVAFCAVLSRLRRVSLADCSVGSTSAIELAKALGNADAAIEELNLGGCKLTGANPAGIGADSKMEGFVALCAVLGRVKTVNLSQCGLGPTSAAELAQAVKSGTTIEWLNVAYNHIGGDGGEALTNALNGTSIRDIGMHRQLSVPEGWHSDICINYTY